MSNQSDIHQAVRDRTSTVGSYNSDWHALFDLDTIDAGPFNARMLNWLNAELDADGDTNAPYSSLTAAQSAYAIRQNFRSWDDMNTLI